MASYLLPQSSQTVIQQKDDGQELCALATSHSEVRRLMAKNTKMQKQLQGLMREPLAKHLQPLIRGYLSRKSYDFPRSRKMAIRIQTLVRTNQAVEKFGEWKSSAILLQAVVRSFLVCIGDRVGKIISKVRVLSLNYAATTATLEELVSLYENKLKVETNKNFTLTGSLYRARAQLPSYRQADPVLIGVRRGRVMFVHADGTYDIEFVDGTKEASIPVESITQKLPSNNTKSLLRFPKLRFPRRSRAEKTDRAVSFRD